MSWISVNERLPEFGTLCDVWVKPEKIGKITHKAHRRIDFRFVDGVGVTDRPAFQEVYFNDCGLYEMAFFLDENIISHWMPSPQPPKE